MTTINLTASRTFAIDLAERALSSAWQGALGAAVPIVLASHTTDTMHLAWWQQLGAAVLVGALAGVLSLVKGLLAGLRTGTASTSTTVSQTAVSPGAHASDKTDTAQLADLSAAAALADPAPDLPIAYAQPTAAAVVASPPPAWDSGTGEFGSQGALDGLPPLTVPSDLAPGGTVSPPPSTVVVNVPDTAYPVKVAQAIASAAARTVA